MNARFEYKGLELLITYHEECMDDELMTLAKCIDTVVVIDDGIGNCLVDVTTLVNKDDLLDALEAHLWNN